MDDKPALRVSDADRERAIDQLRTHCAEGRITPEELAERLDAVYRSKTDVELRAVTADLPRQGQRSSLPVRERTKRRLTHDAGRGAIAVVACVGVWAADGANGDFWPVWVGLAVSVRLAQDAWRLMGPAAAEPDPGRRELEHAAVREWGRPRRRGRSGRR